MANIQEGLMAAAPGGFGGAASGLGMALSANPIGAAVTGAGAVFSFLGARKARKERERSKQAALAALAPSGEEASIRSQLRAAARRGAAGGLPPGLELLSRRQEALSGADVARRDEIADVEGRRRLGAVGLPGSGAGQAALGRAAAERARVRDALGLEREGRLFGASQAERGRGLSMLQGIGGQLAQDRMARANIEAQFAGGDGGLGAAGGALAGAGLESLFATQAARDAGGVGDDPFQRALDNYLKSQGKGKVA